jgi:hypothetical protein
MARRCLLMRGARTFLSRGPASENDPMQKWARTLYLARKRFEDPQLPTAASDIVLGWVCNGAVESSGLEFALWVGTCERML